MERSLKSLDATIAFLKSQPQSKKLESYIEFKQMLREWFEEEHGKDCVIPYSTLISQDIIDRVSDKKILCVNVDLEAMGRRDNGTPDFPIFGENFFTMLVVDKDDVRPIETILKEKYPNFKDLTVGTWAFISHLVRRTSWDDDYLRALRFFSLGFDDSSTEFEYVVFETTVEDYLEDYPYGKTGYIQGRSSREFYVDARVEAQIELLQDMYPTLDIPDTDELETYINEKLMPGVFDHMGKPMDPVTWRGIIILNDEGYNNTFKFRPLDTYVATPEREEF